MARLACSLVLISLCLSLVLEPTLAAKLAPAPAPFASAAAPFASVVPAQQLTLIKKLCQDTKKPRLCYKIVQGDKDTLKTMKPMTLARASIDLAASVASRAGGYMTTQLKKNHVKVQARGVVEGCKSNYESAAAALNLAYTDYKFNLGKAVQSLKEADNKVGSCASALKSGGPQVDVVPIVQTNKVIKDLVQVAQSIATKFKH